MYVWYRDMLVYKACKDSEKLIFQDDYMAIVNQSEKLSFRDINIILEERRKMVMNLKGTKTEKNLQAAFAGESQARNKYTYFASKAKKEGYVQIASIFEETANNEKEHAKMWFKLLEGGAIRSTIENFRQQQTVRTMSGQICTQLLQKKQEKKGFDDIAEKFEGVGQSKKSMKQDN